MTGPETPEGEPPSLENLGARLRQARERERKPAGGNEGGVRFTGLGFAFRIGVELVSALAVGAGVGRLLDIWLGTEPWGLVVFFFLGAGAGVLNVYRTVAGMGSGDGSANPPDAPPGNEPPGDVR
ncbi:MAG: AtpZ/AtpI family protein [Alphaproteobacteria bacterium]